MAEDARSAKLENGERWFSREEWLSTSQIRSFFSRITASRRKQTQVGTSEVSTGIADTDEDFDQWLEEE